MYDLLLLIIFMALFVGVMFLIERYGLIIYDIGIKLIENAQKMEIGKK